MGGSRPNGTKINLEKEKEVINYSFELQITLVVADHCFGIISNTKF